MRAREATTRRKVYYREREKDRESSHHLCFFFLSMDRLSLLSVYMYVCVEHAAVVVYLSLCRCTGIRAGVRTAADTTTAYTHSGDIEGDSPARSELDVGCCCCWRLALAAPTASRPTTTATKANVDLLVDDIFLLTLILFSLDDDDDDTAAAMRRFAHTQSRSTPL